MQDASMQLHFEACSTPFPRYLIRWWWYYHHDISLYKNQMPRQGMPMETKWQGKAWGTGNQEVPMKSLWDRQWKKEKRNINPRDLPVPICEHPNDLKHVIRDVKQPCITRQRLLDVRWWDHVRIPVQWHFWEGMVSICVCTAATPLTPTMTVSPTT